jgi:hypothetical protein
VEDQGAFERLQLGGSQADEDNVVALLLGLRGIELAIRDHRVQRLLDMVGTV